LYAAKHSIPHINSGGNTDASTHRIPGWQEHVAPVRKEPMFWHNLWAECGRPHIGVVANCMRRTRAAYHYTQSVRFVKIKRLLFYKIWLSA